MEKPKKFLKMSLRLNLVLIIKFDLYNSLLSITYFKVIISHTPNGAPEDPDTYNVNVTVDWNDYDSTHVFLRTFIFKLTEAYHTKFNQVAFNEAWNEFSQYLTAGRNV